jgi:hypothetical protein
MEATFYSKMLVDFRRSTWHCIPGDKTLHNHSCENIKSCLLSVLFKNKINFTKFKYSLVAAAAIVAFVVVVVVVVAAEFVAVAAFATVDSVVVAAVAELTLVVHLVAFLLHMAADSQGLQDI